LRPNLPSLLEGLGGVLNRNRHIFTEDSEAT
jgi:hypothetical protein